ncbi:putative 4-carboxymuconolactone decarboxylase domain protein [Mycobacterium kansasii 662]|uniref:4-carboxymuconolactone decarboxylase domain protein n=5 Tax=Mycobacterium kansasii TaxID=1768 RepID=A0A653EWF8_MYCKA|nr:transposase [Mycobacterium kansasii ATCC 12478]EUA02057.1 putative 4-carboxymuconolactone decarboxylase domain protein [Mycobacterium kansasii 824]EUA20249.1 putative 4-carboxymuconolactone decarboxylase domain protein [Mycobacterium kansasii 662]KEP40405.1 transposase [Mycobacterium kansasii]KZS77638.1 hypothetical protein A4G30_04550 [Mycobacterium kansasii]
MTGLQTAAMLEPLRMYAHIPTLLSAYGRLEQAESKLDVDDELFEALRVHLDTAQLVALTHIITLGNLRARFNIALGIEASGFSGFSGNRVCALPPTTARWPTRR